ncbi:MAG: hypothetical protein ACRDT2_05965 [Natronosporangium sp.]
MNQLLDRYLEVLDAGETTICGYQSNIRNHIRPVLGRLPLSGLTARSWTRSTPPCAGAGSTATAGRPGPSTGMSAGRWPRTPSGRSTPSSAERATGRSGGAGSGSTRPRPPRRRHRPRRTRGGTGGCAPGSAGRCTSTSCVTTRRPS